MAADDSARAPAPPVLLPEKAGVVNVGLALFGEAVRAQGAEAVDVDWRPPAGGDPALVAALTRLSGSRGGRVEAANREVLGRLEASAPLLVGIDPAAEVVPGMEGRTVLHSGPPIEWGAMCGPLQRSVRASVVAEGWASSPAAAGELVAGGSIRLDAANHHAAVLPMATSLGPSQPVFVVEDPTGGGRSFSTINQGPGRVAWFGVDEPEAIDRLIWLREVAAPVLRAVIRDSGPADIFSLVAQGLSMGDDVHMRTQATTNLLLRAWLPALVAQAGAEALEVARFLSGNHLFFLNLAMAAARTATGWAAAVPDSSAVVSMARNGTRFGIRLAGTGARWFEAPAPPVADALYHPGFGPELAAPDIGDSALLELVGLGGAAAAASPAVASFLGGTMAGALATSEAMAAIALGRSSRFKLPYLDFRGSPVGVDARLAVQLGVTPAINTGILHATQPRGQIGAGIARAPLDCFRQALLALDATLG